MIEIVRVENPTVREKGREREREREREIEREREREGKDEEHIPVRDRLEVNWWVQLDPIRVPHSLTLLPNLSLIIFTYLKSFDLFKSIHFNVNLLVCINGKN